jgi:hypothetical protein
MAVDWEKVLRAAAQAALEDSDTNGSRRRPRALPARRALVLGASAVTAGRLLAGRRGRDMLERVSERLDGAG